MKTTYKLLLLLTIVTLGSCDIDKFADINSNPSSLSEPNLSYSAAMAIKNIYNNDYTLWFYNNFKYLHPWTQVGTRQGGNTEDVNLLEDNGGHDLYKKLFPQTVDIRMLVADMTEEEQAARQALVGLTYPIQITTALTLTDNGGSLVYSEAGLAPFTTPPLLTPVYDTQQELFTLWLEELDLAIAGLSADNQIGVGVQDFIYESDYSKWAKYCNLLKMRIAARLINTDLNGALAIAEEVVNSDAGYMNSLDDDFIFQLGVNYRGTGNGMWIGFAGKNLVDFLVENRDPRLRFAFEKNDFNGEVVQAFIDEGQALPPYVEQYVSYDVDGNFAGWSGPGEPWVRYFGAPLSPDASDDASNDIYFNQSVLNKIDTKTYSSTSEYSEKLVRTAYDYTYPTKPGGRVLELKDNAPGHTVVIGSSAEMNLLLAEFKLLGANLPSSAQEYFNQGVRLSVERADALADHQQMPYYNNDPVYTDADESEAAATMLRDGEVDALLAKDVCNLSTDGLEKVYIQQYINYLNTPHDLWANVRRSGVPMKGSSYLAWETMKTSGSELVLPRRFTAGTPTADDVNYDNKVSMIKEQGFTAGSNDPSVLNTERLWFDKTAPSYGAGPNN